MKYLRKYTSTLPLFPRLRSLRLLLIYSEIAHTGNPSGGLVTSLRQEGQGNWPFPSTRWPANINCILILSMKSVWLQNPRAQPWQSFHKKCHSVGVMRRVNEPCQRMCKYIYTTILILFCTLSFVQQVLLGRGGRGLFCILLHCMDENVGHQL